jgi:HEAT repeat protein
MDRNPISGAALLAFSGDRSAIPPLIDLLYRRDDRARAAAIDALLYFDRAAVTQALVEALNRRGPRARMIEFLIGSPDAPVAQIKPLLLDALRSENADARGAAVKGLTLLNVLNHPHDPEIFAPLAAMLADPVASVRQEAVIAVGGYADERALRVLRAVVADTDPAVSEQATIGVGWVAQAANRGSATRNDAIVVLRAVAISARSPASDQALTWLGKVDAR